jgi:hypothetical protein
MYYPEHGRRLVGKFGSSRGWRRNRLRTDGGFTVDAIGLDTASPRREDRGSAARFHHPRRYRREARHAGATAKKLATITTSILPAGSETAAVLGIQNLIIPDGIFTQLVDGRADFLTDRIVSGPHPALEGFKYEIREDPETSTRHAVITAGTPTWEGQSVAKCQRLINRIRSAPSSSSVSTRCSAAPRASRSTSTSVSTTST